MCKWEIKTKMSSAELRICFKPTYFSIEDILASQTKTPCISETSINKFGFLDPSQEQEDLANQTNFELPLWAARVMSNKRRPYVKIKVPRYFCENYREALKADPKVVDLNKMGPYFYQSGLQLSSLPNDEMTLVSDMLPELLQKRLAAIHDSYSLHRDSKSTDDSTTKQTGSMLPMNYMDPLEADLFGGAKGASEELVEWLNI